MDMVNPFEACRNISAMNLLERAGIPVKKQGVRGWASCPKHVDRSPSLLVDETGRWHCFSCGRGGDAVDLYVTLFNVTPLEAAQGLSKLCGLPVIASHTPPPKPIDAELKERVETWKREWWDFLCIIKHLANDILDMHGIGWDDPMFIWAIQAREDAERGLDLLQQATPMEKLRLAEEVGRIPIE